MMNAFYAIGYMILAPFLGGLIAGIDRKITARMQGRVGPPILQPFYDVLKLFEKEKVVVTRSQNYYVLCYVVFMVFTGALFFFRRRHPPGSVRIDAVPHIPDTRSLRVQLPL